MANWFKSIIRALSPPIVYAAASRLVEKARLRSPELEFIPSGWERADIYQGWNAASVLEAYKATWPKLLSSAQSTIPFTAITNTPDVTTHNILLCFAYCLALSAQNKPALSMLDWGGGIGSYLLLSRAALPAVKIDYYCKDVPLLAQYGQTLHPEAHFTWDTRCLNRTYDFVLASSSLHYSEDWQLVFKGLACSTAGYFLLTRTPVHRKGPSYVFVQRAYGSEYLGWSLNEDELKECARAADLGLVREFIMSDSDIPIFGAPNSSRQRGFLFRRK